MEIIPLKHASATELVRILNALSAGNNNGRNANNKIKLAADERTNSILISGPRSGRLKIRTTISFLDTPLENGSGNTHVIYLKYAKAKNLVKILSGLEDKKKGFFQKSRGENLLVVAVLVKTLLFRQTVQPTR